MAGRGLGNEIGAVPRDLPVGLGLFLRRYFVQTRQIVLGDRLSQKMFSGLWLAN